MFILISHACKGQASFGFSVEYERASLAFFKASLIFSGLSDFDLVFPVDYDLIVISHKAIINRRRLGHYDKSTVEVISRLDFLALTYEGG